MATTKPIRTKTELKVNDETPAKVIERKDGKTITYEATVSEKEVIGDSEEESFDYDGENETFVNANETGLPFIEEQDSEIPKTKIEKMFAHIRSAIKEDRVEDSFFAMVVRMPDNIGARFTYPCSTQMELGIFQFTSRDIFNFQGEIQRRNQNSGGIFNVKVYRQDQTPLTLHRRLVFSPREVTSIEVGMLNYAVPNPVKDESANGNTSNFANNGVENQIMSLIEKQEERFNQMIQQMNAPKEKSLVEKAFEAKILQDITNPPPPPSNGVDQIMPIMMQSFASMFAMPEMMKGFSRTMFPEPPAPEQKDWVDKASQIFNMPVVQNALLKAGDVAEAIAVSRLPQMQAAATQETEYEDEPDNDKDDMQILLETVIAELESDNPLDHTNAVVSDLKNDFPDHFDTLQTACQTFDFDGVFALLINKSSKMNPSPFIPFLDIEQTQATKKHVWNERGEKLIERLKEFYEYVKIAE